MTRVCAHCGTEVEGEALFCPTCGQPLEGTSAEPELPPAPDWPELPPATPEPQPEAERPVTPAADDPRAESVPAEIAPAETPSPPTSALFPPPGEELPDDEGDTPTHAWAGPVSEQPVPPWRRGAVHRAAGAGTGSRPGDSTRPEPGEPADEPPAHALGAPAPTAAPVAPGPTEMRPAGRRLSGPRPGRPRPAGVIAVPQLLSEWLVGIGALTALLALFLPWTVGGRYTSSWGFASGVNIVMALVLIGVLAVIFTPDWLPRVPQRGLVLLSVGLVGAGIGLDRMSLPLTGAGGIVFLIATVVVAVGGGIAVLGQDRVVGGPQA